MGNSSFVPGQDFGTKDVSGIRDLRLQRDLYAPRNVRVGHDLRVEGWLKADNVKCANKGLFPSLPALQGAYPGPEEGWFAGVLATASDLSELGVAATPGVSYFRMYLFDGGVWTAQPGLYEISADVDAFAEEVESLASTLDSRINSIDLSQIAFSHSWLQNFCQKGTASFWQVTVSSGSLTTPVGVLLMTSDNLKHVVTQAFFTHYTAVDGVISSSSAHDCGKLSAYVRTYGVASPFSGMEGFDVVNGSWSGWRPLFPTVGLDGKISADMLPALASLGTEEGQAYPGVSGAQDAYWIANLKQGLKVVVYEGGDGVDRLKACTEPGYYCLVDSTDAAYKTDLLVVSAKVESENSGIDWEFVQYLFSGEGSKRRKCRKLAGNDTPVWAAWLNDSEAIEYSKGHLPQVESDLTATVATVGEQGTAIARLESDVTLLQADSAQLQSDVQALQTSVPEGTLTSEAVVQTTGDAEDKVMSQAAVTEVTASLEERVDAQSALLEETPAELVGGEYYIRREYTSLNGATVDTGVVFDTSVNSSLALHVVFSLNSADSTERAIISNWVSSANWCNVALKNGKLGVWMNNASSTGWVYSDVAAVAGTVYDLAVECDGSTVTLTVNGNTFSQSKSPFVTPNDTTFKIGGRGDGAGSNADIKVYACSISIDGETVLDYVPAMAPNGDCGLYDLVSEAFASDSLFTPSMRDSASLPAIRDNALATQSGWQLADVMPRCAAVALREKAYIDTGISFDFANVSKIRLELDYALHDTPAKEDAEMFLLSYYDGSAGFNVYQRMANTVPFTRYNPGNGGNTLGVSVIGKRRSLTVEMTPDGSSATLDDWRIEPTFNTFSLSVNTTLKIGCRADLRDFGAVDIYSFRVIVDGNVIADYIPVLLQGEAVFYDLASGHIFKSPQGIAGRIDYGRSVEDIAGDGMEVIDGYRRIEWVETNGVDSYFDTGLLIGAADVESLRMSAKLDVYPISTLGPGNGQTELTAISNWNNSCGFSFSYLVTKEANTDWLLKLYNGGWVVSAHRAGEWNELDAVFDGSGGSGALNGVEFTSDKTVSSAGSDASIKIGCRGDKVRFSKTRFRSLTVEMDGVAVADMVAAIDPQGVPCIYDTVRKTAVYCTNAAPEFGDISLQTLYGMARGSLKIQRDTTYVGDKVMLKKQYGYKADSVLTLGHQNTSNLVRQGCAMYNGLIFQAYSTNSTIDIIDSADGSVLSTVALPDTLHCGSLSFGPDKYDDSDEFPLLYIPVTTQSNFDLYVYRITRDSAERVQTISMAGEDAGLDPLAVVDADRRRLYCYSHYVYYNTAEGNGHIFREFWLPSLSQGDVAAEELSRFELPYYGANQDGTVENGYLFIGTGTSSTGRMLAIDLSKQAVSAVIPLYKHVKAEPEGIFVMDGKVCMTFYGSDTLLAVDFDV